MLRPHKFPCFRRIISYLVIVCFIVTSLNIPFAHALELSLPKPGVMVRLSPEFNRPVLKGIKVHPNNPFRFDFIVDKGDGNLSDSQIKESSIKLIKYFLASLTVPEKDLWVNLSPYEKDRIIPEFFGQTEMGRDLLAQDYMLKQITASLIYPEDDIGKKFWKRIYEEAQNKFGTTNIPVNTFNKVWIVPEKAIVYENAKAGTAYVVKSKLKVMLEEDYLAVAKNQSPTRGHVSQKLQNVSSSTLPSELPTNVKASQVNPQSPNDITSQIIKEIILPELTKEVNEGKNFSKLRQVYQSLILATWYKKKIKDSILSQVFADKNKVGGININDPKEKQKIYEQYLQAYKKGVYNYIKEEYDPVTQESKPRKYFSGGFDMAMTVSRFGLDSAFQTTQDLAQVSSTGNIDQTILVSANIDEAQTSKPDQNVTKNNDLVLTEGSSQSSLENKQRDTAALQNINSSDQLERLEAIEKVASLGNMSHNHTAIQSTIKLANDKNPAIRLSTYQAMETLAPGNRDIFETVLKGVDDEDQYVRSQAITTLGKIGGLYRAEAVAGIKKYTQEEELQPVILSALERIGHANEQALVTIAEMTSNERMIFRVGQALSNFVMADVSNKRAVEILTQNYQNSAHKEEYYSYVEALTNIGNKNSKAITMLMDMLTHTTPSSRSFTDIFDALAWLDYPDDITKTVALNLLESYERQYDYPEIKRAIAILMNENKGYEEESEFIDVVPKEISSIDQLLEFNKQENNGRHFVPFAGEYEGVGLYQLKGIPAIVLSFLSSFFQAGSLDRIAVFVENIDFKGQILLPKRLELLLKRMNKNFMYTGHDYRLTDIAAFFTKAFEDNIKLIPAEKKFRDILISLKLLSFDGHSYVPQRDIVLLSFSQDLDTQTLAKVLNHEVLSHALFMANEDFRKEVSIIFHNLNDGQKIFVKSVLILFGYDVSDNEELLLSEFAAYFQDPQTLIDILDSKYRNYHYRGQIAQEAKTRLVWEYINKLYRSDPLAYAKIKAKLDDGIVDFINLVGNRLSRLSHDFQTGNYYGQPLALPTAKPVTVQQEFNDSSPRIVYQSMPIVKPWESPGTSGTSNVDVDLDGVGTLSMTLVTFSNMDMEEVISSANPFFASSEIKRRIENVVRESGIESKFLVARVMNRTLIVEYKGNGKLPINEQQLQAEQKLMMQDATNQEVVISKSGKRAVFHSGQQKMIVDQSTGRWSFLKKIFKSRDEAMMAQQINIPPQAPRSLNNIYFSDTQSANFIQKHFDFFAVLDMEKAVMNDIKLHEPRLRFRPLGDTQPKVVIDEKYKSIVVNANRFEGSAEDHDLMLMAFIQADNIRGTNFYDSLDYTVTRLQKVLYNLTPLKSMKNKLRDKQRYQILANIPRGWYINDGNMLSGSLVTAYQQIPIIPVLNLSKPDESREDKISALIEFANRGWRNSGGYSASIFAEMAFNTFEKEISARLDEIRNEFMPDSQASIWEILKLGNYWIDPRSPFLKAALNDDLFKEIFDYQYSTMFRYSDFYQWLNDDYLRQKTIEMLDAWKPGSAIRNLKVGVLGAAYGQESVTMAIMADRMIQDELSKRPDIPKNAIKVQVIVLSIPNKILNKLKDNQVVYSSPEIGKYVKEGNELKKYQEFRRNYFTKEEVTRFFNTLPSGGLIRSAYLDDRIEFHAVKLGDVSTYTKDIPALDVVTLHNVLQYVRPDDHEQAKKDFPRVMDKTYDWLVSIVKPGGVISFATEGDGHDVDAANLHSRLFESTDFNHIADQVRSTLIVQKPLDYAMRFKSENPTFDDGSMDKVLKLSDTSLENEINKLASTYTYYKNKLEEIGRFKITKDEIKKHVLSSPSVNARYFPMMYNKVRPFFSVSEFVDLVLETKGKRERSKGLLRWLPLIKPHLGEGGVQRLIEKLIENEREKGEDFQWDVYTNLALYINSWIDDVKPDFAQEILDQIFKRNRDFALFNFLPWEKMPDAIKKARLQRYVKETTFNKIEISDKIVPVRRQNSFAGTCAWCQGLHWSTLMEPNIVNEYGKVGIIRVNGKAVFSIKLLEEPSAVALRTMRTPDGRLAIVEGALYVLPKEIKDLFLNFDYKNDTFKVIDIDKPIEVLPLGWVDTVDTNWKEADFKKYKTRLSQVSKDYSDPSQIGVNDPGGIDFNPNHINLQIQNQGDEIKFNINPAMLQQLQNAPGFIPTIINIQPMTDLRLFLGLKEKESVPAAV